MITCVVHYTIDPAQIEPFERFAREWMRLVAKHGGVHHGYFLPAEGASDRAEALFSFESLAAYERYRSRFGNDPEFVAADKIRDDSGCVVRYERTFMRPLLPAPMMTTMLSIARIEARIPTQDLQRARRWYAEKLGLEAVEEREGGLRYEGASGVFCLFASAGAADGSFTQMAFCVDDIEAVVADLRARGVVFEEYDGAVNGIMEIEGNYPSKGRGERAAWFRDSEGNLLGIAEVIR